MALNFPNSPTLNQVYTDITSGFSYQWNGTVWISFGTLSSGQISATNLFISGISTFVGLATHTGTIFGSNLSLTGVATASSFVGNLTGTATSTTNIPNLTGAITSNNTTTSLGSFTSSQLATALTDETGSGSAVFATSPTLVTPVLGAATATSVVVGSGVTINASGVNASGVVTATTFVGALTGTATSTTNIPNLTGAITSVGTATTLGSFTSSQLATALTDETGSGSAVFATSPVLVTPSLGIATATSINASGIITATQFVGALTGTATSTTNIPNLTGDISSVNTATTLATVNSNVGTFGGTDAIPVVTVNGKGLVTGITTVAPNNGTLTLATSGTGLSGSASFTANQSGASSFTVTSNATNANTPSAIVARDASGNFSAGTITASLTGTATSTTNIPNLTGDVTSSGNATSIAAGVIVNADVNASAAIAGTKINPDFGSQNTTTTGNVTGAKLLTGGNGTAAAPVIGAAADPDTGMFFGTNEVNLARNGIVGMTLNTTETKFTLQDTNKFTIATTGNANVLAVSPGIARVGIREAFPCAALDIKVADPGSSFSYGASWGAATTGILIHHADMAATSGQNIGGFGITYNNTKGAIIGAIEPGAAWKDITMQYENFIFQQAASSDHLKLTSSNKHVVGSVTIGGNHAYINVGSNTVAGAAAFNLMTAAGKDATRDSNVFNIHWDGAAAYLYIDTTQIGSFAYTSDYRIKRNIESWTANATSIVNQLRPVNYQIADYECFKEAENVELGFIAHEMQEHFPEGVQNEKDGEQLQSLKLSAIVALLTKALQESNDRIAALETQVAVLTNAK